MYTIISRFMQEQRARGITLVELVVTLAIFAGVTTVLLGSFFALFSTRDQTQSSQRANDDIRVVLDSMEREIQAGNNITPLNCAGTSPNIVCREIAFVVSSREDVGPHPVAYRLNASAQTIEKAVGVTGDARCGFNATSYAFTATTSCYLPVTGSSTQIAVLGFSVTIPSGATADGQTSPLVTIGISGSVKDTSGNVSPLTYSSSITPRNRITVSDVLPASYAGGTTLQLVNITKGTTASPAGCLVSNSMFAPPPSPTVPSGAPFGTFYTDCDKVNISFDVASPNGILYLKCDSVCNRNIDLGGNKTPPTQLFADVPVSPVPAIIRVTTEDGSPATSYGDLVISHVDFISCPAGTNMTWGGGCTDVSTVGLPVGGTYNATDGTAPNTGNAVMVCQADHTFSFQSGTCTVTNPRLIVCPVTVLNTVIGGTISLSARYWDDLATVPTCSTTGYSDVTNLATWSSSNDTLASVTSPGDVLGVAAGSPSISASYSGLSNSTTVTVGSGGGSCYMSICGFGLPISMGGLGCDNSEPTYSSTPFSCGSNPCPSFGPVAVAASNCCHGNWARIASAYYGGNPLPPTGWYALPNISTAGAVGTACIGYEGGAEYRGANGTAPNTQVAYCDCTVPEVTQLIICPANSYVGVGQTTALNARYFDAYPGVADCTTPTGYTNVSSEPGISWTSGDAMVGTVGATGFVTGVAQGTVAITAQYAGRRATRNVTVTVPSVVACYEWECGFGLAAPRGMGCDTRSKFTMSSTTGCSATGGCGGFNAGPFEILASDPNASACGPKANLVPSIPTVSAPSVQQGSLISFNTNDVLDEGSVDAAAYSFGGFYVDYNGDGNADYTQAIPRQTQMTAAWTSRAKNNIVWQVPANAPPGNNYRISYIVDSGNEINEGVGGETDNFSGWSEAFTVTSASGNCVLGGGTAPNTLTCEAYGGDCTTIINNTPVCAAGWTMGTVVTNPNANLNSGGECVFSGQSFPSTASCCVRGLVCGGSFLADLIPSDAPMLSGQPRDPVIVVNTPERFIARVRNAGDRTTGTTFNVNFSYRWNTTDPWTQIGAQVLHSTLAANAVSSTWDITSGTFTASQLGTLYVQYCVDSNPASGSIPEASETNNCVVSAFSVIPQPAPDIVPTVSPMGVVSNADPTIANATVKFFNAAKNAGVLGTGVGFRVKFEYRYGGSGSWTNLNELTGNYDSAALGVNEETSAFASKALTTPAAGGSFEVRFCVDSLDAVAEGTAGEANNCEITAYTVKACSNTWQIPTNMMTFTPTGVCPAVGSCCDPNPPGYDLPCTRGVYRGFISEYSTNYVECF